MTRIFTQIDELRAAAGTTMGPTEWLTIEQSRVDGFADATDDHQWIHVDVDRARGDPAFGGTIAHGFLTLSLIPQLRADAFETTGYALTVNYGLDRVRFPAPVPAGSRVRARFRVLSVEDVAGGERAVVEATVEREGSEKPVCVAELVLLGVRPETEAPRTVLGRPTPFVGREREAALLEGIFAESVEEQAPRVAIVTARDGAWTRDPFAASPLYRLIEGNDIWRIYRAEP